MANHLDAIVAQRQAELTAAERQRLDSIGFKPTVALVFENNGYQLVDKIKMGQYGEIYKAKKTNTGKFAVIKVSHQLRNRLLIVCLCS